jgi:hypothetical protein
VEVGEQPNSGDGIPSRSLYTVGPQGIEEVGEQFGIPHDDLQFLSTFWKPIIEKVPESRDELRREIRDSLSRDFEDAMPIIRARFGHLTERQMFVMFLMLRVHGSLPVFIPRAQVPGDLATLLSAPRGNCSDHAVRLLIVLDVFDIPGRLTPIFTKSLPGHVVVDAFDPKEETAYLLDSNTNVYGIIEKAKESFFDSIRHWDLEERKRYFIDNEEHLIFPPVFFRYLDPGIWLDREFPDTLESLNRAVYLPRINKWPTTLTAELPDLVDWWAKTKPRGTPKKLSQLGLIGIQQFRPENELPPPSLPHNDDSEWLPPPTRD